MKDTELAYLSPRKRGTRLSAGPPGSVALARPDRVVLACRSGPSRVSRSRTCPLVVGAYHQLGHQVSFITHVPPRRPRISPPRTRAASSVSARRVTRAAAGAGSAHGPGPMPRGPRSPPPPPPLPVECLPPPRGARSKAKAAPGRPRLERPGPAARQPLPQHSLSPSTGTRPLSILSAPAQAPALSPFSQPQHRHPPSQHSLRPSKLASKAWPSSDPPSQVSVYS